MENNCKYDSPQSVETHQGKSSKMFKPILLVISEKPQVKTIEPSHRDLSGNILE
jgi:hypothetical protein